ncbi:TetR-like C-terminal domain-containing protein [Micromonospora sonneratiae]|uniref:TetR-like C-terminal domain-containing protein n=1 Tax=Micromonospora sonneratiae TaxID=1184706 RepID=A0ABW3YMI5_9ACTN
MSDMTSDPAAPRSPGRPRSSRADEAIIEAVLDLLAEGSTVDTLAIEAIAARAGVGKEALLRDALATLKGPPPVPAGHSIRDDLVTLLGPVGSHEDPRATRIMPCLVPEIRRSPEQYRLYQEMLEPRRQLMRDVLRRGVARGELRADLDIELTMSLLTGPVLLQRLLRWHAALDDTDLPERVVDTVLAGIAVR